jgi:collagenase-like PrtC family protease
VDASLQRALQTERIEGRKDWVRYVELKTALYRKHLARIESELAPTEDASAGLERELAEVGEARDADADQPQRAGPVA